MPRCGARAVLAGLLIALSAASIEVPPAAAQETAALREPAARQAGVSAAVRGRIERVALGRGVGLVVESGQAIFLGDRIASGPAAGMQIALLDESVFTIGPDSQLTIDEFVYDPATGAGRMAASVGRGLFRFVTGKVAARQPSAMTVLLPGATIGVRGTMVAGRVFGDRAEVLLLGPGSDGNSRDRQGRIEVSNGQGSVIVSRAGFGTVVTAGQAPLPAFRFPPQAVAWLTAGLRPLPAPAAASAPAAAGTPSGAGGGEPAAPASSESEGEAGSQPEATVAEGGGAGLASAGGLAGHDTAAALGGLRVLEPLAAADPLPPASQLAQDNVVTSFEQLRSVTSGTATFQSGTVLLDAVVGTGSGSYESTTVVDFAARTLDLQVANVSYILPSSSQSAFTLYSELLDYSTSPGLVSPSNGITNLAGSPDLPKFDVAFNASGNLARIDFKVVNAGGTIAAAIEGYTVEIADSGRDNVLRGTAPTMLRQ